MTGIDSGDYMKVQGVDFGEAAPEMLECLLKAEAGADNSSCAVRVSADTPWGDVIAYVPLQDGDAGDGFTACRAALQTEITGVHDLYFVFSGNGYEMKSWHFE